MEVLFATSNAHKVSEANVVGGKHDIVFSQADCPYPEKQSNSLADIAEDGARFVHTKLQKPVIAEDSGLFIPALKGFPGPYSRYVYDKLGCEGILRLMDDAADSQARFISAVAYASKDGVRVFEGQVKGVLIDEIRGDCGFGFDPIFVPLDYDKTFAQDPGHKNKVSHRRMAFELLCSFLAGR